MIYDSFSIDTRNPKRAAKLQHDSMAAEWTLQLAGLCNFCCLAAGQAWSHGYQIGAKCLGGTRPISLYFNGHLKGSTLGALHMLDPGPSWTPPQHPSEAEAVQSFQCRSRQRCTRQEAGGKGPVMARPFMTFQGTFKAMFCTSNNFLLPYPCLLIKDIKVYFFHDSLTIILFGPQLVLTCSL